MLTLFPHKKLKFRLFDTQKATLERLTRRTEYSAKLTSSYTDKSFRGQIKGNQFQLIDSSVGRGAFCVMNGQIGEKEGELSLEIHKVFKVLLSIILLMPLLAIIPLFYDSREQSIFELFILMILHPLFIRFVFIELIFWQLSKTSRNKFRDVTDVEWK